MLKIGDKAPDFKLKNNKGEYISLSDFRKDDVILYFYPKDNTPGCTQEACSFKNNYNEFKEKKAVVIGINKDDEKSHNKFIKKYGLPFILLSDINKKVCKLYGTWGKKKFMGVEFEGIIRTTFIIKKGIIKDIIREVSCKTHAEDILKKHYGADK